MSENRKPIIEPDFYKDFHCIGGQCSFTCCKEWKIAVDPETKKRWWKLHDLEQRTVLSIVTGEEPLSSFDDFTREWGREGGSLITSEVRTLYGKK